MRDRKEKHMTDYMVRAIAAGDSIRAFAATTREMAETARSRHDLSPVACAALGRLLTAGSMMGRMLKGDKDVLTLQINCGGPIGGLTVTAGPNGRVKGYVKNPSVMLPPTPQGKLDVGGALGIGVLSVIRDLGLKDPYIGQIALQTGEIAEDLTYYFATSEQTPSSVGLGVLMNRDNTVKCSGGFIIQVMPDVSDEVLAILEESLKKIPPVTTMLDEGDSPEDILGRVLAGMDMTVTEKSPVEFYCHCSRPQVEKVVLGMGREELENMIEEGEPVTVNCHFCNENYVFYPDQIRELISRSDKGTA